MGTFGLYKEKRFFKSGSWKSLPGLRIDVPPTLHYIHWTLQQGDTDNYRAMAIPGDTAH